VENKCMEICIRISNFKWRWLFPPPLNGFWVEFGARWATPTLVPSLSAAAPVPLGVDVHGHLKRTVGKAGVTPTPPMNAAQTHLYISALNENILIT